MRGLLRTAAILLLAWMLSQRPARVFCWPRRPWGSPAPSTRRPMPMGHKC